MLKVLHRYAAADTASVWKNLQLSISPYKGHSLCKRSESSSVHFQTESWHLSFTNELFFEKSYRLYRDTLSVQPIDRHGGRGFLRQRQQSSHTQAPWPKRWTGYWNEHTHTHTQSCVNKGHPSHLVVHSMSHDRRCLLLFSIAEGSDPQGNLQHRKWI